jgi:predicted HicB family RNase H-like nuclease
MSDEPTITQLRIAPSVHEYISRKADELGVSRNAMICVLIDLGRRVYEADVTLREAQR